MAAKIKPYAYNDDGYSYVCKACMARTIVEESVSQLERNLRHIFRDHESLIKASAKPVAIKVRKRSGLDLRRQKIGSALDDLLGAFFEVWEKLEDDADHERATVKKFRKDRAKGGKAKDSKSLAAPAKIAARDLWPEASRKGWTAARFHRALSDGGHVVASDTVRKWVTALRKTGTC